MLIMDLVHKYFGKLKMFSSISRITAVATSSHVVAQLLFVWSTEFLKSTINTIQ